MVKLILLVGAVAVFTTAFLSKILAQFQTSSKIILDLYNSNPQLLAWISKMSILFSHPIMLVISSIYIVYFIISKTIYS